MPVVMKFGGTSVADAAAFENVARIVANERDAAPVVVVSAMSGVTDSLLAATNIASLENVFDRHPQLPASSSMRRKRPSLSIDSAKLRIRSLLSYNRRLKNLPNINHFRMQSFPLVKLFPALC